MKIFQPIGTPGAALPQVGHAAAAARWGADRSRFIELPTRGCDLVRPYAASDSLMLEGSDIKSAGIPSPRCERSP